MIEVSDSDRSAVAEILETIAKEGLDGPRDLDVALDAIFQTVLHDLPADTDFNYLIGYRLGEGGKHLACYMYGSREVFFGNRHDAAWMLSYVRSQQPEHHWEIIPVRL